MGEAGCTFRLVVQALERADTCPAGDAGHVSTTLEAPRLVVSTPGFRSLAPPSWRRRYGAREASMPTTSRRPLTTVIVTA
jgi:hypothetical protein